MYRISYMTGLERKPVCRDVSMRPARPWPLAPALAPGPGPGPLSCSNDGASMAQ